MKPAKPAPAPKPKPSAPPPSRPPQRTPPPRVAPKPNPVPKLDGGGWMRRGFARALGGAIAGIVIPDPLNSGEDAALGNPSVRHPRDFAEGVAGITVQGDQDARVHIGPGRNTWMPPQYRLPAVGRPGLPDSPVRAPDGSSVIKAGARTSRASPRNSDLEEYDPFSEEGFSDWSARSVPRQDDDPWYAPQLRRGIIQLPGRNPVPVPVPLPPPLPVSPGFVVPPGVRAPAHRPVYQPSVVVTVQDGLDGPSLRIRPRLVRDRNLLQPRYRDSKFGKRLVGVLNYLVTATYGVVSEAQDAAEVFSWSLYGRDARGRVVPAMLLEDMSMAETFRGYLEGDYRLDTVGFAMDFAINQVEDYAYAKLSQAQLAGMQKVLGEATGYKVNRQFNWSQRMEGNSYVQSPVSAATEWMGSFDAQRSRRVRGLWS